MDTIMWPAHSNVALSQPCAAAKVGQLPDAIRTKCIVVDDTFVALKQFARALRETWGGKNRGRYRLGGKNHDQRDLRHCLARGSAF